MSVASRCKICGAELKPGYKYCGMCRTPVQEEPDSEPDERKDTRRMLDVDNWKKVNRMINNIALSTDEKIVRQYRIGTYTLRQGTVEVIVTNKRVIRYETSNWMGMQSNRLDEVNLDAVHGVSCTMARSASVLGLTAAGVMGLLGLFMLSSAINSYSSQLVQLVFGILLMGAAVLILLNSFRPSMDFCVHGALGAPALNTSVNVMGRLFGRNNASIVFQFKPTRETVTMLEEIGACIYDLKTLGDKAMEKWC